jgi:hypothetical protein
MRATMDRCANACVLSKEDHRRDDQSGVTSTSQRFGDAAFYTTKKMSTIWFGGAAQRPNATESEDRKSSLFLGEFYGVH